MSNTTDWDSKTVIGFKAKAPKVTRNTSDLNGKCSRFNLLRDLVADECSSCMSSIRGLVSA